MDISMVVNVISAAISSGVTSGLREVGKKSVLEAYDLLKTTIRSKFGQGSVKAIEWLEKKPGSKARQALLMEEMEDVNSNLGSIDADLMELAKELIKALSETATGQRELTKYQIDARKAQIGIVGDFGKIDQLHYHAAPGSQTDAPTPQDWERFYLKRLITHCDHLDLTPLEESRSQDGRSGQGRLMRVSDIFTTLYLKGIQRAEDQGVAQAIQTGHTAPKRSVGMEKEQKLFPIAAIEAAGVMERLVILGRPGGGKSTLVNHLATQTAHLRMGEEISQDDLPGWPLEEKLLPVRIGLRRLAAWIASEQPECHKGTEGLIWGYLAHQLNDWGCQAFHPHLKHTLDSTGGVIFFDGLDEVREQDDAQTRALIVEAIEAFARPLKSCRVIITCRQYAYQQSDAWRLPAHDFPVVELDLFHSDQIQAFTHTWYGVVGRLRDWNDEKCAGEANNLCQAIEDWPHLKALAQYPLLLTLMAQVHGHDGYLPRDRADLYERALKLLLVHWDNRIVRDQDGACRIEQGVIARLGIRTDTLRSILEQVALAAHEAQERTAERSGCADIAREDLRQALAAGFQMGLDRSEKVMAYIQDRAGLLQAEDNKIFRFPHRTFQEYLAAGNILKKSNFEDFLSARVQRDLTWWQEVFLLAAGSSRGTPRNIYQLVDALLPENVADTELTAERVVWAGLAAQAMGETGFLDHVRAEAAGRPGRFVKIHQRVQEWLLAALSADTILAPKERVAAGNALNWVGDPRFDAQKWHLPKEENNGFITIPAGEFWMGRDEANDKEAYENELPRHHVRLSAYAVARYPVTVAQYRCFVQETDFRLDGGWHEFNRYANHPVVDISWNDAKAYCEWLTEKLQLIDQHIGLPTEAQWELAARGSAGHIYPWGNAQIEPNRANYLESGIGDTSPVGAFPGNSSPYGAKNMVGNVWEWCQDWYGIYLTGSVTDPQGPSSGSHRVGRGGSWGNPAVRCRAAFRSRLVPGARSADRGFRLALLPGQPE